MLTRGRAQRLVLKAAELKGREAYRLRWRYEPVSTVDLQATTFCGDTSWILGQILKDEPHPGSTTRKKQCHI